jgi:hypothetical protein
MPCPPNGLPARPKHILTHASGRPGPVTCRAGSCSCRAKSCGPAHLPRANFSGLAIDNTLPGGCAAPRWCSRVEPPASRSSSRRPRRIEVATEAAEPGPEAAARRGRPRLRGCARRGRPRLRGRHSSRPSSLRVRCPLRTPPERGAGRQPCLGGAGRPGTTAQRPQAHSGGRGAWRRGTRRIGFSVSDGARSCSTTDIMSSSGSRTEHGQLLELVSGRGEEGC